MNGKILWTGVSPGATIRSPRPPKEHAIEHGNRVALCGAAVGGVGRLFAFSPFACQRCTKIINANITAADVA